MYARITVVICTVTLIFPLFVRSDNLLTCGYGNPGSGTEALFLSAAHLAEPLLLVGKVGFGLLLDEYWRQAYQLYLALNPEAPKLKEEEQWLPLTIIIARAMESDPELDFKRAFYQTDGSGADSSGDSCQLNLLVIESEEYDEDALPARQDNRVFQPDAGVEYSELPSHVMIVCGKGFSKHQKTVDDGQENEEGDESYDIVNMSDLTGPTGSSPNNAPIATEAEVEVVSDTPEPAQQDTAACSATTAPNALMALMAAHPNNLQLRTIAGKQCLVVQESSERAVQNEEIITIILQKTRNRPPLSEFRGTQGLVQVYGAGSKRYVIKKPIDQRTAYDDMIPYWITEEITVLLQLRHPNIVSLLGVYESRAADGARAFCQIMPYEGETLHSYASNEQLSGNIIQPNALNIASQLFNGLAYIHSSGYLMRDIKPDNIVGCLTPGHQIWFKYIDFGFACLIDKAGAEHSGTPGYAAPELLNPSTIPNSEATDLYSLGVVYGVIAQCHRWEPGVIRAFHNPYLGLRAHYQPYIGIAICFPAKLSEYIRGCFGGLTGLNDWIENSLSSICWSQFNLAGVSPRRWVQLMACLLTRPSAHRINQQDLEALIRHFQTH